MSFSSYGAYKDTDVAELGEVPVHWNVVPLKHIVETPITDGPHETPEFIDDGIPFVSAEAVSSGEINFSKSRFISHADHHRYSKKYKPRRNDIFMVKSGATTGVVALVSTDRDFNIWSPLAVVRCSRLAFPRYVLQAMRSRNFQESVILNWSFGTQQNIGMSVIENLRIPLPPIPEQTQIARFLDHETARIDALIEEQQRLIELLKEKRQAVISHAVTKGLDPTVPMKDSGVEWLGEVPEHWVISQLKFNTLEMQTGPFGSQLHAEDYVEGGVPLVNPAHMIDGKIIPDPQVSVDEATWQRLKRHALTAGDIIFARRGELGRCAIVTSEQDGWLCGTGSLRASLNTQLDAEYAYLLITSKGAVAELSLESKGSTMENLNTETLGRIRLPLPSVSEQKAILEYVHEVSGQFGALVDAAESAINLITERRSALISAAVTGKIDVRGWQPPASAQAPQLAVAEAL